MFAIGDMIIYGGMGVCRVEAIESRKLPKSSEEQSFYVLQPLYQTCSVSTPVDNGKVFMRPVISKEEAERLIETIPGVHAEVYNSKVLRQISEHYESILKHYDCAELIELTMSIYAKKRICEEQKRKLGALDERYMKRAEDMLFGELAVALGIDRQEVQRYIREKIES